MRKANFITPKIKAELGTLESKAFFLTLKANLGKHNDGLSPTKNLVKRNLELLRARLGRYWTGSQEEIKE